jgi:L-asparaginase II
MVLSRQPEARPLATPDAAYPDNPVLVHIWRGSDVESQHRGAWVVTDAAGKVIDGAGQWSRPIFVRSSVKCLQALPLLETGAAARFHFSDAEVALALSSHNAETCHTEAVAALLDRMGLSVADLKCGAQPPGDPEARARLRAEGLKPSALHNNCSGKHAGFLALALHLGVPAARYIDPSSAGQVLVREAVLSMSDVDPSELTTATDGCSAPTFRMPLQGLAKAFARVSNPRTLAPSRKAACERMLASVAAHAVLIAGSRDRICTEIVRETQGRIFPKVGGDAVYGIGVRGADLGLAVKMDDGSSRGLHAVVLALLRRFRLATDGELSALGGWEQKSIRNWAGIETGRTEVLI